MAGLFSFANTGKISTGTALKTLLQIVAPSNHRLLIHEWSISFDGVSNTATPIWGDDGKIGEYRARSTNQFPSTPTANQVIFGDLSQVLILEWLGRDVVVDPYTAAATNEVILTVTSLIDLIIRQGKSFAISSDSGAQ